MHSLARISLLLLLAGLAWPAGAAAKTGPQRTCDNGLIAAFRPDANTRIVAVRPVARGTPLLGQGTTTAIPAAGDLCLVKLLVGPPTTLEKDRQAPAYSEGIGIEIWLPAGPAWNHRIRNWGGGGWAGGDHRYPEKIGSGSSAIAIANMGFAVGTTDTGHPRPDVSFGFLANGKPNAPLLHDFIERSLVELAVKTKALVTFYYGEKPRFSYFDGQSQGGRQALEIAQNHPELYDGFLAGQPGIYAPYFGSAALYPQLVLKDLLGFTARDKTKIAAFLTKAAAVNARAVRACDSEGLGFLIDPARCSYDPGTDPNALCAGVVSRGTTGTNGDGATCMSAGEAEALNRIWYGPTSDGSWDGSQSAGARSGLALGTKQMWWGPMRGAELPPRIANAYTDNVALAFQRVDIAADASATGMRLLENASTPRRNAWMDLSYAEFATLPAKVRAATAYAPYLTDRTDLSRLRSRNHKVIVWNGWADELIPPSGAVYWYDRVTKAMGGTAKVQAFMRMYMIPGAAHSAQGRPYAAAGSGEAVPLPLLPGTTNPVPTRQTDQLFTALSDWVEKGIAPGAIPITSRDKSVSYPLCLYPQKIVWDGKGSARVAASYRCE